MANNQTLFNLDPNHFLAPQKVFFRGRLSEFLIGNCSNIGSSTPNDTRSIDTTTLASADFDVDVQSGFLSPSPPLKRLTDQKFNQWELAFEWIQDIIHKKNDGEKIHDQLTIWKEHVMSEIEILEIDSLLADIIELRRAHLILAFLTHAFVHSNSILLNITESDHTKKVFIPASLAVPFTQISHALDIPPVLTYADTVLYNWYLKNPALGFTAVNLEIITTFTQTKSEKHFYKTSILVEAIGPECLKLMRSSLDEAFMGDSISIKRIAANLEKLSKQIDCISKVLDQVRTECDPKTFYMDIRPWFNAGKWTWRGVESSHQSSTQLSTIPNETNRGEKDWRVTEFGGPSAGQSTLIHAIDIFLGVNHEPSQKEIESGIQDEETFMKRMSTYMPHHHRSFLNHLTHCCLKNNNNDSTKLNLIRSIVIDHDKQNSALRQSYNACIASLENLRTTHARIVSLYIISQKNSQKKLIVDNVNEKHDNSTQNITSLVSTRENQNIFNKEKSSHPNKQQEEIQKYKITKDYLNQASHNGNDLILGKNVLKGTGGTDLSKFLKRCKLRTSAAFILDNSS